MDRYVFFFLLVFSIVAFYSAFDFNDENIPASKRLTPTYDKSKDESEITNPDIVITAKQMLLVYMDSLEKIFDWEYKTIPYVKFGTPSDMTQRMVNSFDGAYRPDEKAIYFRDAVDHLIAVQLGTVERNQVTKDRAINFERVSVHELGHFTHDLFLRNFTSKPLKISNDNASIDEYIEHTVIGEGIADWAESQYHQRKWNYMRADSLPDTISEEQQIMARDYGIHVVGPILDVSAREGLKYIVRHPFKIECHLFAESVKKYQTEALAFLRNQ